MLSLYGGLGDPDPAEVSLLLCTYVVLAAAKLISVTAPPVEFPRYAARNRCHYGLPPHPQILQALMTTFYWWEVGLALPIAHLLKVATFPVIT